MYWKVARKGADEQICKDIDCYDGKVIKVSRDGGRIAVDARRAAAYLVAIRAWNMADGSSRNRIKNCARVDGRCDDCGAPRGLDGQDGDGQEDPG